MVLFSVTAHHVVEHRGVQRRRVLPSSTFASLITARTASKIRCVVDGHAHRRGGSVGAGDGPTSCASFLLGAAAPGAAPARAVTHGRPSGCESAGALPTIVGTAKLTKAIP